jgi:hypothetical protein
VKNSKNPRLNSPVLGLESTPFPNPGWSLGGVGVLRPGSRVELIVVCVLLA